MKTSDKLQVAEKYLIKADEQIAKLEAQIQRISNNLSSSEAHLLELLEERDAHLPAHLRPVAKEPDRLHSVTPPAGVAAGSVEPRLAITGDGLGRLFL